MQDLLNVFEYERTDDGIVITGLATQTEDLLIPEGVVAIADSAFFGEDVETVAFPSSLREIHQEAFCNCDFLRRITFPTNSQLLMIGNDAFRNTGINALSVPSSLKRIESGAFAYCEYLEELHFGKSCSLEYIGDGAFESTDVTSLRFPDSLVAVGELAFYECDSLEWISWGENASLVEIGDDAFSDCTQLMGLALPPSLQSIGSGAFEYCESLGTVRVPSGVMSIGERAFFGCDSLQQMYMYESTLCSGLAFGFIEDESIIKIIKEDSSPKSHKPDTSLTAYRTSVGEFGIKIEECLDKNVEELVVPECVTEIGDHAFSGCKLLKRVKCHGGLVLIRDFAFSACPSLREIDLPENCALYSNVFRDSRALASIRILRGMGEYCLAYSGVKEVTFEDGVDSIPEGLFAYCEVLESVDIPSGVTYLGPRAFYYCTNLHTVTIGEGIRTVSAGAFLSSNLVKIKLPSSVDMIMERAFYNCTSLRKVDLGQVCEIREGAFFGCRSLHEIVIPATVYRIADEALDPRYLRHVCVRGRSLTQFIELLGKKRYVEFCDKGVKFETIP